ncbi:MAG: FHA domain-containing protein [Planctomycetes bacterium]|nr:FHA domain-containing protein [Planctomycetota bacterium]
MDRDKALEHARQVSREVVWLGLSDRETMSQYLAAFKGYVQQGIEGTFTQLISARGVIDRPTRKAFEVQFPFEVPSQAVLAREQSDRYSTAVLRSVDLEDLRTPNVNSMPSESSIDLAVAWLECEPLEPVPVVPGGVLSFGREETCDVVLPHQGVSRIHAEVRCEDGRISLEDGSTFGTFVNGEKVHRATCELQPGDVIAIGPYMIIVRDDDPVGEHADTLPFRIPGFAVEAMHGTLSDVALSEVLQQIEFNEKTGTLRVITGRERGLLAFERGRPQWAQFGAARDADAVYRMLRLADGEFSFVGEREPGEQTMLRTVTGLLMEFSRQVDEG